MQKCMPQLAGGWPLSPEESSTLPGLNVLCINAVDCNPYVFKWKKKLKQNTSLVLSVNLILIYMCGYYLKWRECGITPKSANCDRSISVENSSVCLLPMPDYFRGKNQLLHLKLRHIGSVSSAKHFITIYFKMEFSLPNCMVGEKSMSVWPPIGKTLVSESNVIKEELSSLSRNKDAGSQAVRSPNTNSKQYYIVPYNTHSAELR